MKKFLLIDDHVVVRSGIKTLFHEIFAATEIHEAGDGDSAVELLKNNSYELILLDIQLPKTDALVLMEFIHIKYPSTKVLIFSSTPENLYAKRFLKAGAKGFISKEASLDELKKAIYLILNGRVYVSESFALSLAKESLTGVKDNPFDKLTSREFEIAGLLLSGITVTEISKVIFLQVSTVGTHKMRLFEKLGVENVLQLKELAIVHNFRPKS